MQPFRPLHAQPPSNRARLGPISLVVVLGVVVLTLLAPPISAQQSAPVFASDEFQINTDETTRHLNPTASFHRSGSFVTVWESTRDGILARFYNRNQTPLTEEVVLVPNDQPGPLPFFGELREQEEPVVAMGPGRSLLLFWTEETVLVSMDFFFVSRTVLGRNVLGQAFDLQGRPLSDPFPVSPPVDGLQQRVEVATDAEGAVTVVWERRTQGLDSLQGRRFSPDGTPLTDVFTVVPPSLNDTEPGEPSVASLDDGTSLVVWEECCDQAGDLGIFGRFFDAGGNALSEAEQINTTAVDNQRVPVAVGDLDGRFLVAWQGPTGEVVDNRPVFRTYARHVNLGEGVVGDEAVVSNGTGRAHSSPALALGIEGDVILAWMAWVGDFRIGVYGTRLRLDSDQVEALTEAFRISEEPIGGQFRLGLSATPTGRFLVAWEGFRDDDLRIIARLLLPGSRLSASCTSDDGGLAAHSPGSDPCAP